MTTQIQTIRELSTELQPLMTYADWCQLQGQWMLEGWSYEYAAQQMQNLLIDKKAARGMSELHMARAAKVASDREVLDFGPDADDMDGAEPMALRESVGL